jgi:hypothetical protein
MDDMTSAVIDKFIEKNAKIRPSFKIKKRRSAVDRLKSRNYYRTHKQKIKLWRKRYNQKMNLITNARKFIKRENPKWLYKKKKTSPKPGTFGHILKKFIKNHSLNSIKPTSNVPPSGLKKHKITLPKYRLKK